jgi:hypothetical protein
MQLCASEEEIATNRTEPPHSPPTPIPWMKYLAYIHLYTRLHRRPPAETDLQQYFRVNPPSVHQMLLTLNGRA